MSEEINYQEILANVPNCDSIKVDALINTIRLQRDQNANSIATLSAELEAFKIASNHYHQMALGFQAQFSMLKANFELTATELSKVKVERDQLAEKLLNVRVELQDSKAITRKVVDTVNKSISIKDVKQFLDSNLNGILNGMSSVEEQIESASSIDEMDATLVS